MVYLPTFTIKINQMKENITIHGSFGIGYHDDLRPNGKSSKSGPTRTLPNDSKKSKLWRAMPLGECFLTMGVNV